MISSISPFKGEFMTYSKTYLPVHFLCELTDRCARRNDFNRIRGVQKRPSNEVAGHSFSKREVNSFFPPARFRGINGGALKTYPMEAEK